jgi:hypothetical protein
MVPDFGKACEIHTASHRSTSPGWSSLALLQLDKISAKSIARIEFID